MKKIFILLVMILFIPGCRNSLDTKTPSQFPATGSQQQDNSDIKDRAEKYPYINPNDVEWMTMQGGLRITTKVLFPENSPDKIKRIAGLINKSTNKMDSTEEEIGGINSRARPVGIAIKMKDGTKIFIWPSYKITTWEKGWSAAARDDRFVLSIEKDGKKEYHTVLSKDVAAYLRKGWQEDIPRVSQFTVSPNSGQPGDKVTLAGDGCTEKEVRIYFTKDNREEYLIDRVKPVFGAWKSELTMGPELTTLEGQKITLGKGVYQLTARIGDSSLSTSYTLE